MFLEVVLRPHELLGLSDFEPGFVTTLPFTLETERCALRSHAGLATEGEHKRAVWWRSQVVVSGPPIRLWAEVYFLNVQRGKPSAKSRLFARAVGMSPMFA
jgi:hypothetical protein